ncbi:Beta,beta-carotene 15,15'-monooxygenase [Tolypocladium paradoxum]|uniref:Beta,beta-carotene 15,15'-monooxygenase n=1 Tax=Tolypocladium paradoxum TaxID=94208 RepID=A0A2S4KX74_9HYPO|nr:Beta,beta-carotene 15,15'-monooxygenase [Tolypocladium paradoxum]
MAVNASGILHRTVENEAEDCQQAFDNVKGQSWKEWPNHAAVSSHLPPPVATLSRHFLGITLANEKHQFEGLDEHRGPLQLQVKGTIPAWAAGALYRTGPGQGTVEDTSRGTHYVSHWFDGFAHSHKFDIISPDGEGGETTVVYSSRRQSDDYVAQIKKIGWRCSVSFGQRADPCIGLFAKFMSLFVPRRLNNNVVVLPNFPGLPEKRPVSTQSGHRTGTTNLYISTDNRSLQEVDPDTLEPLGFTDQSHLHPDLKGPMSCAHAQRDPETGDWFNFNLAMGRQATYRIFRVNAATGTTDILASVSEPDILPAYIHSFFLTENYVVLCIPSSHLAWNGLKIYWENNLLEAIKPFDETRRCKWVVVDRRHGRGVVARFSTPAAFFFHSVNAFEEHVKDESGENQTYINLDHSMYDTTDVMFGLYYDTILDRNDATKAYYEKHRAHKLHSRHVRYRFRMPLSEQPREEAATATAEEVLSIPSPHSGDLSTIHPERATRPYRYMYGTCSRGLSTFMDSLVKTDLETRKAVLWSGPQAHTPGEPVFVPRPGGTDEDDGVVLSVVLDGTAQKSYLLCLDAKTMEELGRAEADFAIAMGFHGFHAPVL